MRRARRACYVLVTLEWWARVFLVLAIDDALGARGWNADLRPYDVGGHR